MNNPHHLRLLTALLLACFVGVVHAEPLDEAQARYAAAEFFSPLTSSSRLRVKGQQMMLRSVGHEAGIYIFDRPEGGTVFVADDDAIGRAVLGYTDQGSFDAENLPIGLRDWLEQVALLMDAVHEGKLSRKNVRRGASQIVVEALVKTQWDQGTPYNNLCPVTNSKKCITGCVATAMAQVLNYWKWPEHGYGSVSYYDDGCGQTLTQDLSKNHYDWNNMLNVYSTGYTSAQANAVATLMRDCGYAVQMRYTPTSSCAGVSAQTMHTYFHYSATAKDRYSGNFPEELWHEYIRRDLMEKRPVLYSGQSQESGHEFILDGYDTEGYYHVNWGWGGYQDGWFVLTNLNGYNSDQWMINHLMPDKTESADFSYTLEDGVLTINGKGMMPAEYAMDNAPWASESGSIRKIVFGQGITNIVDYFGIGFDNNASFSNLAEVALPEGLQSIGCYAFYYSQLKSVQLPSSVANMDNAFQGCNLKSLHLPKDVESYTDYLPECEELTVDENNPYLSVIDNILYDKSGKYLLFIPRGIPQIILAETTQGICNSDFFYSGLPILSKCQKAPALPQIIKDNSLYNIRAGGALFIPCSSTGYEVWEKLLTPTWLIMTYADINLLLENRITWQFDNGTLTISGWGPMRSEEYGYGSAPYDNQYSAAIQKLVIDEGVNSLCWGAYWGYYHMCEADLPSTLTYINSSCFGYTGLTSITCRAKQAPGLGADSFLGLSNSGTLRVPEGADYSSWLSALPAGWTIEYFKPEVMATCYFSNGEQQQVYDLKEWRTLQQQYPNAIGIIRPAQQKWAHFSTNMLIEDATAEGGYRCPYFLLTDLTSGYGSDTRAPLTNFSAPSTFAITKGEYKRVFQAGHNTVCLPFGFSRSELPKGCQLYTYSHFDTDKGDVIFKSQTTSEAGHASFVICQDAVEWQSDLAGKTVTALQASDSDDHARGTFTSTEAYKGTGYAPRRKDDIFAPLGQYLHPFRACIFIDAANAPSEVHVQLRDDDVVDGLNNVGGSPAHHSGVIYSLDGKRISVPRKGQPYIKDGKLIIAN
jgi:hypothetical protein